MKSLWQNSLLMEEAASGEGAGGGAGSLLTTPNNGGGSSAAGGGTSTPSGAAGGGVPAGNPSANNNPTGNNVSDWRSGLPKELQEEPSLKVIHDIPSLAKSFIHAQRTIGADKIPVPGKHATDEDWKAVYTKLGLPADVKDYDVKFKEGLSLDKDFVTKFKETAHASGILPAQAQKLADWFQASNETSEKAVMQMREAKLKTDVEGLKTEWGAAFDKNLGRAAQVLREVNDPELNKYLDETGLGNDTRLIRLFSKVADKFMKEDTQVGEGSSGNPVYTPKEALRRAQEIIADLKHPYHNREHANHKAAVQEVTELFGMTRPTVSKT